MKRFLLLAAGVALAFTIMACGSDKSSEYATPDYIKDEPVPPGAEGARVVELEFTPETILPNTITLNAGEKALFVIRNTDEDGEHNFLSSEAELSEILVYGGQTVRRLWTVTDKPGTYEPLCTLHPWIKMTMIVE
ncbi:hypothetical protein Selin_0569 [Desulfurispirillum indicum S5]|uniref:EfeO-type cupredoxin-like domain-containing protein n=1 Tax=Desulfurispirillum indicum (strain ATCC BAA-1389 / DSM 22839 / S5) TaxID=653733 RepID=E6W0Y5_DESIS|nr:cupredoxin domain-containing protein [Desulfurispirillum indicum]ADU65317.1 hypothetical protein Selin_0569 [Desulfurispirillum indicum S5]